MTTQMLPYQPAHAPAVRAFNGRLRAAGIRYAFPESSVPAWLPPSAGERLFQEFFLAVDDDDFVRGGYILKHQDFVVCGSTRSIGAFQMPLSEGTIDRSYASVGVQLLRHALKRQPLLYTLGIGGYAEDAARLLRAARFSIEKVPFYFRVERAGPFLRQTAPVRTSAWRRLACDVGAASGIGGLAIGLLQRSRTTPPGQADVGRRELAAFDSTVDSVWDAVEGALDLSAVRDARVLSRLYDRDVGRFIRIAIYDRDLPRGWAVLLSTKHHNHKYFGDMRVGSLVDVLAVPGFERAVIDQAVQRLRSEDVDIIVTNQSLGPFGSALRSAGFFAGPSNFLFAASPQLLRLIGPLRKDLSNLHLDRGDGDGPINL